MLVRTMVASSTETRAPVQSLWHVTGNTTGNTCHLPLLYTRVSVLGTGLTPGKRTGPWRCNVRTQVDQLRILTESPAPLAPTVMTVTFGLRLMVSGET